MAGVRAAFPQNIQPRIGDETGDPVTKSKSGCYKLDYDMVPTHVSHKLAEKIFFIGESIQLFESDKRVDVQVCDLKLTMNDLS